MLTPVEDLGLAGARLSRRLRAALRATPPGRLAALLARLREEAALRHVVYFDDGHSEAIRVLAPPLAALPEQLAYVRYVSLTVVAALGRLPALYFGDGEVRAALRLPDEEEGWLRECWGPAHERGNPIFGRLDAVIDFESRAWRSSLKLLEPNLTGVGGIHLGPTCDRLVRDVIAPEIARFDPRLDLRVNVDARELLMLEIVDHLEAIGRRGARVCFVEPKYAGDGLDEQEELVRYFRARYGVTVVHADPAELELDGEEVRYGGEIVDLAYRDYAVADLLELSAEGVDVEPMRRLLRQNRVISSIAGDLDQKSCFEVLSDPALVARYFSAEEREVFRRHILWTRLLEDRRTSGPDGRDLDLLAHARRAREELVLKPNRGYGGDGVLIGAATSAGDWEAALGRALEDDADRWVVQERATLPRIDFQVLGGDGRVRDEPFHVIMGFAPSRYGLGVMARASQGSVVNVAQRGGMCAVMIGQADGRTEGDRT